MSDTLNIETVRVQADALGISYHHRAGAEKIAGLVAAHLAANPADALKLAGDVVPTVKEATSEVKKDQPLRSNGDPAPPHLTRAQAEENMRKYRETVSRRSSVEALRRVRIQCMNPAKREWPGEIISVGNLKHGTFKKFIPFNGEPYHIPQIIYDALKERKCTLFRTVRDERGNEKREGYLANEFSIQDLPPLTEKELDELRAKQRMAKNGL
jgi:hypothetical protein